jgi:hypothetical protein
MKNFIIVILFLSLSSCGFQYLASNSDKDKTHAAKVGNQYYQNLKNTNEISSFKLISVEEARMYIFKNQDTVKEVYEMIYEVENNNSTKEVHTKFIKKKQKLNVKSKNLN